MAAEMNKYLLFQIHATWSTVILLCNQQHPWLMKTWLDSTVQITSQITLQIPVKTCFSIPQGLIPISCQHARNPLRENLQVTVKGITKPEQWFVERQLVSHYFYNKRQYSKPMIGKDRLLKHNSLHSMTITCTENIE